MKIPALISVLCLLPCVGCVSPSKSSYVPATPQQVADKIARNNNSRDYGWNLWNYAGSDDQYDYIYEYTPGSVIPYGFAFYKLPAGSLTMRPHYGFDPDFGNNMTIF